MIERYRTSSFVLQVRLEFEIGVGTVAVAGGGGGETLVELIGAAGEGSEGGSSRAAGKREARARPRGRSNKLEKGGS